MLKSIKILFNKFYKIPYVDPYWTGNEIEIVFRYSVNGKLIKGKNIGILENAIKRKTGVKYAVSLDSGRSALRYGLEKLNLEKNSEILLPSFGCTGTIEPIISLGHKPVFVDISEDLNIDPDDIENKITDRSKAIIIPHLCGKPANLEKILKISKKHDLYIIDDAAQSFGAKYKDRYLGTFGDFGILSFRTGKVLSATGGGMLISDKRTFQEKDRYDKQRYISKLTRALDMVGYGGFRRYYMPFYTAKWMISQRFSRNSQEREIRKIANIDAKLAYMQLEKIDENIQKRKENARKLTEELSDIEGIKTPEHTKEHIFTKYTITLSEKTKDLDEITRFVRYLQSKGIEPEWFYTPLHLQKRYKKYYSGGLKLTDDIWKRVLNIPCGPSLNEKQINHISNTIRSYFKNKG